MSDIGFTGSFFAPVSKNSVVFLTLNNLLSSSNMYLANTYLFLKSGWSVS